MDNSNGAQVFNLELLVISSLRSLLAYNVIQTLIKLMIIVLAIIDNSEPFGLYIVHI